MSSNDTLANSISEKKVASPMLNDVERRRPRHVSSGSGREQSADQVEKKNVPSDDEASALRQTDGAKAKQTSDRADDERPPNVQNTVSPVATKPGAKRPENSEPDGLQVADNGRAKARRSTSGTAWQITATRFGVQYRSDKNLLLDQGSRVMGASDSAQEVAGMFELAQKKGWDPLDFNGGEQLKSHVIKAALEKGFTVTTRSEQDAKLYAKLKSEFDAQHQSAKQDGPDLESPQTKETELVRKDRGRTESHSRTGAPSETYQSSSARESPKDYSGATKVLAEHKLEGQSRRPQTAENVQVRKEDAAPNRERGTGSRNVPRLQRLPA